MYNTHTHTHIVSKATFLWEYLNIFIIYVFMEKMFRTKLHYF